MSAIYFDDFDSKQLDRATTVLAGISGGVPRAVGSALKRAGNHGKTAGMKLVAERYSIGENELKRNTRNINTVIKDGATSIEVTFGYRGNVIPLILFDTKFSRDGKVSARVLRSDARKGLDNAFVATMNGHTGIYERLGPDRIPIEEKFGPSAVQAFYADKKTTDKMNDAITAEFDKRIEREITRVLNGWGG
jgi:hypothetical protein